jgi:4-hydroxy-4-methyl-2-oxoglutarate aldolase
MKAPPITLGRLSSDAFGTLTLPPLPVGLVAAFRDLPDLTGMCSDAMDELGLAGAISGTILRASDPSARIVGRALTVHNVRRPDKFAEALASGVSMLADVEAHNLAEPGDVLVLQGVDLISNMGNILASIARRQGEVGAIVDGGVRDVDHSRGIGYPVWSRSLSPITGKWRIETIAINKPVTICGIPVTPGDLVLADEVGVCFVPRARAEAVLERAQRISAPEETRQAAIKSGASIAEVMGEGRR